jgi:hypothetical protein
MKPKRVHLEAETNTEVSTKTNVVATGRKAGELTRIMQWSRTFFLTAKSAC